MARHSTGENNYSVSKGFVALLAVLLLVIAGGIYAWVNRDSDTPGNAKADCPEGSASFHVAASNDSGLVQLLQQYSDTAPVVQDHCVTGTVREDIESAAGVAIAGSPDGVHQFLAASGRSGASENWPIAAQTQLGLVHKDGADFPGGDWSNLKDLDIAFPADNPTVSAAVAVALANGDAAVASQLLEKGQVESLDGAVSEGRPIIAATRVQRPEGYSFYNPDDYALSTYYVPLTSTDKVPELQARAAFDFGSFLESQDSFRQPDETHASWLATASAIAGNSSGTGTSEQKQAAPAVDFSEPRDTLVLLDTSAAMGNVANGSDNSWLTEAQSAVADYARAVGGAGTSISLWNYSSPLNPGVTKGWRQNVTFDEGAGGEAAANHVVILGSGGESWTRSSVVAALGTAADRSRAIQKPVNLTVLTTGTADLGDDTAYTDELNATRGDADVRVNVIHIGKGDHDQALENWAADATGGLVTDAATPQALRVALQSLSPTQ